MSFDEKQESVEDGAPIELYLFEGESTFAFTSGSVEHEYLGVTYLPKAIKRSAPNLSVKSGSGDITLTFPFNDPFVTRYLKVVPPYPEKLTIFTLHLSESTPEVNVFWRGFVSGVKFDKTDAKVSLTTLFSKIVSQIPRRTFSWACNHVLFDGGCKLAKQDFEVVLDVVGISSDRFKVYVTGNGATIGDSFETRITADANYFNGGTVRSPSLVDSRMVIKTTQITTGQYANTYELSLMVPMDSLESGDIINLTAGCNHSIGDCFSRFDNTENYGGFPFVPTANPFATDNSEDSGKAKRAYDESGNPILIVE